jgi:outer membrane protein assembly factor BamA
MRALHLIFAIFLTLPVLGQKPYQLSFHGEGYQQVVKHPKTQFKDSSAMLDYVRDFQLSAIAKGYITASIDSLHWQQKVLSVHFYPGPKMGNLRVEIPPEELTFLRKHSRISEKFIAQLAFTPQELSNAMQGILRTYLNQGYPFASLQLDDVSLQEGDLKGLLQVNRGEHYLWTEIHVKGDSSVSPKYISNLIEIKIGDPYDESEWKKVTARIEQVPFLKEIRPSEILFTRDGAELYVYVESLPISSINGILGFQPDPVSKKLLLTGDLNLRLMDVLHRGELLDVRWQSIRAQTQSLDAVINYPFLFNTPFGIDASFELYKRDTSFLELTATAGVQYFLNQGSFLKAFYRYSSSNILSGGGNNNLFTELGNVSSNSYGISYTARRVDYLPNPSRGINVLVEGSLGTRKSTPLDTLLFTKSLIYRGKIKIEGFIPLHKRHVLRLASQTDFYSADNIYQNEVYRYGGLTSQRGFNEDELFATTKTTATIEYRFLLDRNSHVFAFFDQSWYENNSDNYYNDLPYGFGVGFSFSTKLGVFSISYALGKQFDNPVLLSNSKVHFGYVVFF